MKDSPNYFKMNPGSKEVDSPGTFKNTPSVLNMGSPVNYGTEGGDDKKKQETAAERRERLSLGQPGSGMQASAGQRKGKIAGINVKANVGKQSGATDLWEEGKKAVKKIKSYFD